MKISNKAITNKFLVKSFFIAILIIGASAMVVFAWTEPTLSPPDGNASAPINVGATGQSKLGNLSIGTATISYPLTVNGIVQIGTNLYLNGGTTKYLYASGNELRIGSLGGGGFISFYGNDGTNREIMRMTGANLGIGTTIPSYKLDVRGEGSFGATGSTNQIHYLATPVADSDAATKGYVDSYSGSYWTRTDGNIYPTTLTDKIGIGTTIPSTNLDIDGQIKIRGGVPGAGKVLTSDAVGLATWSAASAVSDGDWTISGSDQYSAVSGNVGIGTTIPGTKLTIYASTTDSTGGIKLYHSTNPLRLSYWSQQQFAMQNPTTGNYENMLDANGNTYLNAITGNVGIGTTIPGAKLDVKGSIWMSVTNVIGAGNAYGTPGSAASGYLEIYNGATGNTNLINTGGYNMNFGVNNSTDITILNGGNVGIATTSPQYKLDVRGEGSFGTASSTNQIHYVATPVADSDAATKGYADSIITGGSGLAGSYWTKTASGDHIYNNNTGNVGIGTTATPLALLHVLGVSVVDGTSARRNLVLQDSATAAQGVGGGVSFGGKYAAAGSATQDFANIWGIKENANDNDYAGALLFGTRINGGAPTEQMRISSAGNVGIGTTDPGAYKLNVNGQILATNYIRSNSYIQSRSTTPYVDLYQDGQQEWKIGQLTAGSKTLTLQATGAASPDVMTLLSTGNVGIGTTIPGYKLDVWDSGTTAMTRINNDSATRRYTGLRLDRQVSEKWFVGMNDTTGNDNLVFRRTGTTDDMVISTSGYVGIGTTAPISQLSVAIPYAKTDTTERDAISMLTNDTNPFKLNFSITGAATIANRKAILQTSDSGLAYGGNLILQPNTGNVGIGTTLPSYKLDVRGEGSFGATGATNQIHYVATPAASSDAATKGYVDSAVTTGDADWAGVGGDPTLAGDIYHTGKVGIGTTVPVELLHLKKDQAAYTNIKIENTNSAGAAQVFMINDSSVYTQGLYGSTHEAYGAVSANSGFTYFNGAGGLTLMADNASGVIKFATGGNSEKVRINSAGYVGIGTTVPGQLLDVVQSSNGQVLPLRLFNPSTGADAEVGILFDIHSDPSNTKYEGKIVLDRTAGASGGLMRFYTSSGTGLDERMVIDNSGSVGIATTSPQYKLDVRGEGSFGATGATNQIHYVATPAASSDAATKGYVDSIVPSSVGIGTVTSQTLRWNGTGWIASSNLMNTDTNVGIGSTVPATKLDVNGNIQTGYYYSRSDTNYYVNPVAGGGTGLGLRSNGSIYAAGTDNNYFAGNVGIGTGAPAHNLQVNGYNTTGASVINTNGSYNFTNPDSTFPRGLGLGIISGPVAADIPLSGLTGWIGGYGGYIGAWSDVTAATEGATNAAGIVSILRGTPSDSNAFGFYSDLSNFSGSGGNKKYGIYSTGETYNYFAGNVGIGSTTPTNKLDVFGYVGIGTASAGGAGLYMRGNNITGVAKLTVETIDPVYEIDGVKYATYAASIAGGVKEEYSGKAKLSEVKSQEYEYIIDFDKVKKGSDLWVWRKAVDFSRDNVDVLVTPYGSLANIYYLIEGNNIIIRGDKPAEFSYRLSGKRFDWKNWPTLSKDQNERASFIIK